VRVEINTSFRNSITLPIHYNHILQSFIYRNLNRELATFLHEKGYIYKKRKFKLFTFSKIIGRYKLQNGRITFTSPIKITISSPVDDIISEFARRLIRKRVLVLFRNKIEITGINVQLPPVFNNVMDIYFLTPVVIYSTLYTKDKKKKTYYYSPKETEFQKLIRENLLKKYLAFHRILPDDTDFKIIPANISSRDEKILKFKNFIIKGWLGKYKIEGSKELIKFAYYTGLGTKNSQGFGMFEVVKQGDEKWKKIQVSEKN